MTPIAIAMMALFIVVIWGGLVISSILLARTSDDQTGELGTTPGTDDASLA